MKKIISILLLIVTTFSLSACNKSNNTSSQLVAGSQSDVSSMDILSQSTTTSTEVSESTSSKNTTPSKTNGTKPTDTNKTKPSSKPVSTNTNNTTDKRVVTQNYNETLAWPVHKVVHLYNAMSLVLETDINVAQHTPVSNLKVFSKVSIEKKVPTFIIGKGETIEICTFEYYKVLYNEKEYFVYTSELVLDGETIQTRDNQQFKVGQTVYNGKYHSVVVLANGDYCCSDGCTGELGTGILGLFSAGPNLSTLTEYCNYADSCYVDTSTGIEYPLCTKKIIYTGKYGTVYALSNERIYLEHESSNYYYPGFYVVRNKQYRKMTIQDAPEDRREEIKNQFGENAIFSWDYSLYFITLEDAIMQADSFKDVAGGASYSAIR